MKLQKLSLSEFKKFCKNVYKPNEFVYATANQKRNHKNSTMMQTFVFNNMDIRFRTIIFQNNKNNLMVLYPVKYVLLDNKTPIFPVATIVCENYFGDEEKYTILLQHRT